MPIQARAPTMALTHRRFNHASIFPDYRAGLGLGHMAKSAAGLVYATNWRADAERPVARLGQNLGKAQHSAFGL